MQLRKTLQTEQIGSQRDDNLVSSRQSVRQQHRKGRRRVQNDVIILFPDLSQAFFQLKCGCSTVNDLSGFLQQGIAGDNIATLRRLDTVSISIYQQIIQRTNAVDLCAIVTRAVALRVKVNVERFFAFHIQSIRKSKGCRCFSNAAFLVGDSNNFGHVYVPPHVHVHTHVCVYVYVYNTTHKK